MKLKIKNTTSDIIYISDIGHISFIPGDYTEIDTLITPIQESNVILGYIAKSELIVNNYDRDMLPCEGTKFLLTGTNQYLKDPKTGKMIVQETSKFPGLLTYWTGRGDLWEENGGVSIGDGERIIINHKTGDNLYSYIYADFCTIDNLTQIHEGYMIWQGAIPGDIGSCSLVTSVMPISAGTNTMYNLYDALIIPAAGDGTIELLGDPTNSNPATGCLVEIDKKDDGSLIMPAFWNADFNSDTHRFENITPAPMGDGRFNMFAMEITVARFVNQIHLLSNGFERLQSADSDTLNHGLRVKIESTTSSDIDHEWTFSAIMTLQRSKTITI